MPAKRVPAPVPAGGRVDSRAEREIRAVLGGEKPLTSAELRELMRAKLEAILVPLEQAVLAGRINVLDYAQFLAKFGLGEKAPPAPQITRQSVVMLPPRNNPPPSRLDAAQPAEVVRRG
jgi:hypothetical protein